MGSAISIVKLKDVGEIQTGNTPSTKNSDYYCSDDHFFYKPSDLDQGDNVISANTSLSKVGFSVARRVKKGAVLVTCIGATIGKTGLLKQPGAFNQQINSIEPGPEYDPTFVYYQIISPTFQQQILTKASSTTLPILNKTKFSNLKFRKFPLPEQRAIVAKLEWLLGELDRSVAELEAARAKLGVWRQSLLREAFSGLDLSSTIESVADVKGGYAFRSKSFSKSESNYQVIKIGNVKPGKINLKKSPAYLEIVSDKILDKAALAIGDVLVTLTGTKGQRDYGWTAVVDKSNLLLNQRVAALQFDNTRCKSKFFLYYSWTQSFRDQFFKTETGNTGQGNVGMKSVRKTKMPLPPVEDQHQIVQHIETRFSVADKLEEEIAAGLERARGLRQGVLKRAFAGELVSDVELAEPSEATADLQTR